jgi:geranylgeranyl diphosphate synthase, type I
MNDEHYNVKETLDDFRKKIDLEIGKYLSRVIQESKKQDIFIADALGNVKKFVLSGGKRLRSALMYYGYLGAGGTEKEKMLKTAVSIELVHAFLLIHDDIMDRDEKRHGVDTIYHAYSKIGKKLFPKTDYNHFGTSMALVIGDMVGAMGNQIIFDSKFRPEIIMRALSKLQSIISITAIGQSQDLYIEYKGKASEKEIMRMYENKTAKYTIEGPLHLGALLGGGSDEMMKKLSQFAIPVGIAFQIQDDILGVFGSESKTGKAVGADVREGKQTILVAKARQKYNRQQKNIFEKALGNPDLNKKDLQEFQKIVIETGALEYAKKTAIDLINQGKKELESARLNEEAKKFLLGIADYLIQREV